MIDNSIFTVSGIKSPYPIQRINLDGDTVIETERIGSAVKCAVPVLVEVSADTCV